MSYKKLSIIIALSIITGCTSLEELNKGLETLNNKLSSINNIKTEAKTNTSKEDITALYNKFVKGRGYFKNLQKTTEVLTAGIRYNIKGDFYNTTNKSYYLIFNKIYQEPNGYKTSEIKEIYIEGKNDLNNGWQPIDITFFSVKDSKLIELQVGIK